MDSLYYYTIPIRAAEFKPTLLVVERQRYTHVMGLRGMNFGMKREEREKSINNSLAEPSISQIASLTESWYNQLADFSSSRIHPVNGHRF